MANLKIHIIELGPVTDCELTPAPVMLFTGKSNLGKSYVNFLSYYVYNFFSFFSDRITPFLRNKITVDFENAKEFSFTIKTDEIRRWMEEDVKAFFRYLLSYKDIPCDIQFIFDTDTDKFEFVYKEPDELPETEAQFFTASLTVNGVSRNTFMNKGLKEFYLMYDIKGILCQSLLGKTISRSILFPPGRASLLSGNFSTQNRSSRLGMYDIFLRDNDDINRQVMRQTGQEADNQFFISQIHKLLNGDLQADKEGISLVLDNGKRIPLDAAASSVKELSPLMMWMLTGRIDGQSVCIEEPEAHLHPEMQIAVADLLAACVNKGTYMQITTHSDYFMQRVNQLLKLGCLKEKNEEAFKDYCRRTQHNSRHYLDRKDVNAYYFYTDNGTTKMRLMEIGEEGIPMSTFFNAVDTLAKQEEEINSETENHAGTNNENEKA